MVPTQNALLSITRVHVSVCPATRGRPVITHSAVDRHLSTATPAATVLTTLTATSRFADVSSYFKSHYLKQNISWFFTYCKLLLLNKVIFILSFKFNDFVPCCAAWCQSDSECGLTEQCVQGQCSNPCETRGVCGMNAECRIYNHVKQCSCPTGFTGNHSVECVRSKLSSKTSVFVECKT